MRRLPDLASRLIGQSDTINPAGKRETNHLDRYLRNLVDFNLKTKSFSNSMASTSRLHLFKRPFKTADTVTQLPALTHDKKTPPPTKMTGLCLVEN